MCGECGSGAIAYSGCYVCRKREKAVSARKASIEINGCDNGYISARKLEGAILRLFTDWLDEALWEVSAIPKEVDLSTRLEGAKQILQNAQPKSIRKLLPEVVEGVKFFKGKNCVRPIEIRLKPLVSPEMLAPHSVVSWNPLADWLQAVDKLRKSGFGSPDAISSPSAPALPIIWYSSSAIGLRGGPYGWP